jgi:hypothetical protein
VSGSPYTLKYKAPLSDEEVSEEGEVARLDTCEVERFSQLSDTSSEQQPQGARKEKQKE